MLYYKNNLEIEELNYEMQEAEIIAIKVKSIERLLTIVRIYRPPDKYITKFLKELGKLLKNKDRENVCYIGDINLNIMQNNYNTDRYTNKLAKNEFMQLINDNTREEIRCGNIVKSGIDHI